jgi:hypothetical protein
MTMKRVHMHLLRLGVCGVAGGLTYAALRRGEAGIAAKGQAAVLSQGPAAKAGVSHDKPVPSLTATVRRLMRAGDVDGVRSAMRAAAKDDPPGFLGLLRQMPYLMNLEGMQEAVREAGSHLAWGDPQALQLLRQLGSMSWSGYAWEGYVSPQVGKAPDAEILDLALRYHGSIGPLVQDAVEKRPREFMTLLKDRGCTTQWYSFFTELQKAHPELTPELLKAVPVGGWGDGDNHFVTLYAMTYGGTSGGTSPENLMAMLDTLNGSSFGPSALSGITGAAFAFSDRDHKDEIVASIAGQPQPMRNIMLESILSDHLAVNIADLDAAMTMSSSLQQQEKALAIWLKMQPDLDPSGHGWLDRLPTEKLRAKALELKNAAEDGGERPPPLGR